MKTLILLDRFYSYNEKIDEKYLSKALIQLIKERISEYNININLKFHQLHQPENRPILFINGKEEDELFAYNLIKQQFGTIFSIKDLKLPSLSSNKSDGTGNNNNEGLILRGRMRDPSKVNFGIFIDCGIEVPSDLNPGEVECKDVLLPIHTIRKQLFDDKKVPLKKITKAYGFFEEMPVYVKIVRIDKENKKIECELSQFTVDEFKSYIDDGFEILFSAGVPRKRIKKAIKRTGHYQDYITIERLGFLETKSFLKLGTSAPGILSEIGPLLNNARFSMLRPKKINQLFQQY